MSQQIGIVGCSAEGAALCYRTLCLEGEQFWGRYGHPEISMHTHSFADYMEAIERQDWCGVGELMLASANKLKEAGSDFLICPDNTIHQALPFIQSKLPLPWLHIAEVVAEEAAQRRIHEEEAAAQTTARRAAAQARAVENERRRLEADRAALEAAQKRLRAEEESAARATDRATLRSERASVGAATGDARRRARALWLTRHRLGIAAAAVVFVVMTLVGFIATRSVPPAPGTSPPTLKIDRELRIPQGQPR